MSFFTLSPILTGPYTKSHAYDSKIHTQW